MQLLDIVMCFQWHYRLVHVFLVVLITLSYLRALSEIPDFQGLCSLITEVHEFCRRDMHRGGPFKFAVLLSEFEKVFLERRKTICEERQHFQAGLEKVRSR